MYDHLPGMNMFRMPALIRVFSIFCFLVCTGIGMQAFFSKEKKKLLVIIISLTLLLIASGCLYMIFRHPFSLTHLTENLFSIKGNTSITNNLVFNGIIQFVIICIMLMIFLRKLPFNLRNQLLTMLVIIDLCIAVRLNGPHTIYSEEFSTHEVYQHTKLYHEGFPNPEMRPVELNNDNGIGYQALWLNMNCFYKQPAIDGYNPFNLRNYEKLQFKNEILFKKIILNSPVYMAHNKTAQIDFTQYQPTDIEIQVKTDIPDTLILLQNQYPGWQANIDDHEVPVLVAQTTFLSVSLPAGKHHISFYYRPWKVLTGFYISLICLVMIFFYFLRPSLSTIYLKIKARY